MKKAGPPHSIHFRAKKSLGQNFLTSPRIVEKIVACADLAGEETVVEVGPGFGVLTAALLRKTKKVIAIEKDDFLYAQLKKRFPREIQEGRLELIHADALTVPPPTVPYFLVANIPYNITSPLLDHFIRDNYKHLPLQAVLLVQKEVAEKICAAPPDMNVLALHIQTFGTPKIVLRVGRANFNPVPGVDSAVVKIEFDGARIRAMKSPDDYQKYFGLIHKAFSHKRKMLRGTLPQELLTAAGIEPTRRAQTLTCDEWWELVKASNLYGKN